MTDSTRSEPGSALFIEFQVLCFETRQGDRHIFEVLHPPLPPVPSALCIQIDWSETRAPSCTVSYDPDGQEDSLRIRLNSRQYTLEPITTLFDTRFRRISFFLTTSRSISAFHVEAEIWNA